MRSRLLLIAALVVGAATPIVGASAACAGSGERAALVVDTGSGAFTYCVELTDDSVSGLELIELANDQHGLQYRFGDGGQAVCMLANVGAEGDDCFGEYPDFWGYWRGDGNGGWTWSSVGAGSTLVRDGDIQGWAWGSGQDGTTHPKPPATDYEDVCPSPAATQPKSDDSHQRSEHSSRQPETVTTADGRLEGRDRTNAAAGNQRKASGRTEEPPQESDVSKKRLTPRTATASGRAPGAVTKTTAAKEPARSGPPTTGLVAIAIAGALGAGGAMAMRRRKP